MIFRETEEQLNRRRQIMLDELEHIRKQLELEESYYQGFIFILWLIFRCVEI